MSIKTTYFVALILAAPAAYYFWTHVWSQGLLATTFDLTYLALCLPMLLGNWFLAKAMLK